MLTPWLEVTRPLEFAALSAAADAPSWIWAVEVVAAVAVAGLVFIGSRYRAVAARLHDIENAKGAAAAQRTANAERERKLQKDLETWRQEALGLKQELGQLRKKNHAIQEETKGLRDELKLEKRLRVEAQNTRPAFAELEPRPAAERPARPVSKPVESSAPKAPAPAVDAALTAQLEELKTANKQLQSVIASERQATTAQKDELRKLKKRAEDLRRIDLITKSKTDLLEERLRTLGRDYYNAISELAALKGEVVPPRPRDPAPEVEARAEVEEAHAGASSNSEVGAPASAAQV